MLYQLEQYITCRIDGWLGFKHANSNSIMSD